MIIGIISDTHIPSRAKRLPGIVLDRLSQVDHIIHAGDINELSVIETLQKLAPITAVFGNRDTDETKRCLNEKESLTVGGVKIGVFHGHGEKGKTLDRVIRAFRDEEMNCIIFGHSHMTYCRYHAGTLLFNPGSPTDKRKNPYYSFGLLEIGQELHPRIIYFDAGGQVAAETTI